MLILSTFSLWVACTKPPHFSLVLFEASADLFAPVSPCTKGCQLTTSPSSLATAGPCASPAPSGILVGICCTAIRVKALLSLILMPCCCRWSEDWPLAGSWWSQGAAGARQSGLAWCAELARCNPWVWWCVPRGLSGDGRPRECFVRTEMANTCLMLFVFVFLQEQVIEPAITSTRNVIDAAVRRVVLTSSVGAVHMNPNRGLDRVVLERPPAPQEHQGHHHHHRQSTMS